MVLCGVHMGEQTAASIDYEREVVITDSFPLLLFVYAIICFTSRYNRIQEKLLFMFSLRAEQKTIQQFMGESTNIFLIPD